MTDDKVYFSNSSIQAFKDCPRKWFLAEYLRLSPAGENWPLGNMWIGTLCHEALQGYYKCDEQNADAVTAAYDALMKLATDRITECFADVEDDPRYNQALKATELAMTMVQGYFEWLAESGADSNLTIVGIEQELEYELTSIDLPGYYIVGKADLIVCDDLSGHHYALDHKTGAGMPDLWAHRDQLMTYSWLHMKTLAAAPAPASNPWVAGGILNTLRRVNRSSRSKPPYYGRVADVFNTDMMRTFEASLSGVILSMLLTRDMLGELIAEGILGDEFYARSSGPAYPHYSDSCSWKCNYFHHCEMFTDGSAIAAALQNEYAQRSPGPGDRYVALPSMKKEDAE